MKIEKLLILAVAVSFGLLFSGCEGGARSIPMDAVITDVQCYDFTGCWTTVETEGGAQYKRQGRYVDVGDTITVVIVSDNTGDMRWDSPTPGELSHQVRKERWR